MECLIKHKLATGVWMDPGYAHLLQASLVFSARDLAEQTMSHVGLATNFIHSARSFSLRLGMLQVLHCRDRQSHGQERKCSRTPNSKAVAGLGLGLTIWGKPEVPD